MAGKAGIRAEEDLAPPAYIESPFKTSFASMSLYETDRILLMQFPPEVIVAIRDLIKQNWRPGIQDERTHPNSHEFKCRGNPWVGQVTEIIPSRILIRSILAHLFAQGWILTASTGVSKMVPEKDSMLFRKQVVPPPASEWLAIAFHQNDKLRLIGAPTELVGAFQALLRSMDLLQEAAWKDRALDTFDFKIVGWPWLPSGPGMITSRLLLLRMLETLEAGGWSLYATVHQTSVGEDSWYCLRAVDWVPGNSVFHR